MLLSSFSNATCWRHCLFPIGYSFLLCQRLVDHIFVGIFLHFLGVNILVSRLRKKQNKEISQGAFGSHAGQCCTSLRPTFPWQDSVYQPQWPAGGLGNSRRKRKGVWKTASQSVLLVWQICSQDRIYKFIYVFSKFPASHIMKETCILIIVCDTNIYYLLNTKFTIICTIIFVHIIAIINALSHAWIWQL